MFMNALVNVYKAISPYLVFLSFIAILVEAITFPILHMRKLRHIDTE
jgi:hypothetical protein